MFLVIIIHIYDVYIRVETLRNTKGLGRMLASKLSLEIPTCLDKSS